MESAWRCTPRINQIGRTAEEQITDSTGTLAAFPVIGVDWLVSVSPLGKYSDGCSAYVS